MAVLWLICVLSLFHVSHESSTVSPAETTTPPVLDKNCSEFRYFSCLAQSRLLPDVFFVRRNDYLSPVWQRNVSRTDIFPLCSELDNLTLCVGCSPANPRFPGNLSQVRNTTEYDDEFEPVTPLRLYELCNGATDLTTVDHEITTSALDAGNISVDSVWPLYGPKYDTVLIVSLSVGIGLPLVVFIIAVIIGVILYNRPRSNLSRQKESEDSAKTPEDFSIGEDHNSIEHLYEEPTCRIDFSHHSDMQMLSGPLQQVEFRNSVSTLKDLSSDYHHYCRPRSDDYEECRDLNDSNSQYENLSTQEESRNNFRVLNYLYTADERYCRQLPGDFEQSADLDVVNSHYSKQLPSKMCVPEDSSLNFGMSKDLRNEGEHYSRRLPDDYERPTELTVFENQYKKQLPSNKSVQKESRDNFSGSEDLSSEEHYSRRLPGDCEESRYLNVSDSQYSTQLPINYEESFA